MRLLHQLVASQQRFAKMIGRQDGVKDVEL